MGYRYIGNKYKLLDKILSVISSYLSENMIACDLMTGTATVASAFRSAGYRVIASDVMTYSFHHANVQLMLSTPPTFGNLINKINMDNLLIDRIVMDNYDLVLMYLNNLEPRPGFFWNEYSQAGMPANGCKPRNYFSPDNSAKIDSIRMCISHLYESGCINDLEHSLLLHDLIMAVNNVANIAGTYGHYMSKTNDRSKIPITLIRSQLTPYRDTRQHQVLLGYAEDLSKDIQCDLCYIDPPYMKRQYAANYHILETIAREDYPDVVGVSGLRNWWDQYSDFCSKIKVFEAFRRIITQMKCPIFIISYSEDGLIPLPVLSKFLSEFGVVKVDDIEHKRFRSNNSPLSSRLNEYLIHLQIKS
jgi:adenine-specific DNA-methyltransferase